MQSKYVYDLNPLKKGIIRSKILILEPEKINKKPEAGFEFYYCQ